MANPLDDAETFIMDSNLYIKELGKKPVTYSQVQAQYMGLIKVRRDIITRLINIYDQIDRDAIYDGQNFDNMYMTSFIQLLINLNWQVKAKLVSNGWLEIDTVDDLDCYNQMANDGSLKNYCKI
jgi:choline kinase